MPNASYIATCGRVEYLPNRKSKAFQATIGLCESTAAGGGPTAGGGAGTYFSRQQQTHVGGRKAEDENIRTSSRVFSAITLCIPIPTPSITASKIAHPIAEFLAALNPPRIANEPPVRNPAPTRTPPSASFTSAPSYSLLYYDPKKGEKHILAFQGSSFFRNPFTAQSNVENKPPHTPKLPPNTGARALMAVRAPIRRSP